MFDYSSNNDNALIVVKNVIHKHTSTVKNETLSYFIDKVLNIYLNLILNIFTMNEW